MILAGIGERFIVVAYTSAKVKATSFPSINGPFLNWKLYGAHLRVYGRALLRNIERLHPSHITGILIPVIVSMNLQRAGIWFSGKTSKTGMGLELLSMQNLFHIG